MYACTAITILQTYTILLVLFVLYVLRQTFDTNKSIWQWQYPLVID